MSGDDFQALKVDIQQHGQREPVLVDQQGRILDGRNRYRACAALGIAPKVKVYDGTEDKVFALVVSLNLHRRHLDVGQRAMVAAKLATLKHGVRADAGIPASVDPPVTQAQAAELLHVSRDSVQQARKVQQAEPAVIAAVEAGEVSLNKAISTLKKPVRTSRVVRELRHPVHRGSHHRDQDAEMDRGILQIETVVGLLLRLEPGALDRSKRAQRSESIARLREHLGRVRRIIDLDPEPRAAA